MAPIDRDQLERLLAGERAELDDAAARRIDERVRATRESRRFWQRLTLPSARRLGYAGAAATLLVGLVVGVAQIGDEGGGGDLPDGAQITETAGGSGDAAGGGNAPQAQALGSKAGGAIAQDAPGAAQNEAERLVQPNVERDSAILPPVPPRSGGLAPGQEERVVERSATIRLSGDPGEVRQMADEVIALTDRLGGIVVSASVSDVPDSPRQSRANLEIAVPIAKLDQALAEISEVGSVEAREQSDLDVTSEAVSARNRLRNARDTRKALRERLEQATDADEIERLRRALERAERRVAVRKADVQRLANRTQFARIHIAIVANGHGDDGSWSLGDAWDDAVEVLRTMAGVALVTAAIVIPLALLITLTYLATSRYRRRSRESALDK